MRIRFVTALLLSALLAVPAAYAQKAPAPPPTDGEVRRLDATAGTVTLKHGPIPNLDMPAMTMTFRARERAMLDGLKVGDRVSFTVEQVDGSPTLTSIKPAK
jgi:Cu/Ag efflux protein CusF